ncbi:hypothetical protein E2C01_012721 [Portunus trituberculatus]|uniref:Uncharacterized protein n=1 Tax=Portunus trituberculatus TaxID=210409 RepID=A0A5B7DEW2_PORTR|nr:hypothetical protein [Portunus trituberculatus]
MHITLLQDPNQVLFGACGVRKCGDDQCSIPVVSLPYATTCIYHTPVPNPIWRCLAWASGALAMDNSTSEEI